jgi:transposase
VSAALESVMTHIPGSDRSQLLLLPGAIGDYVAADNHVRFIDAFVDALDLKAAGFARVEAKATGRLGYAPWRSAQALHLRLSQPHPVEPAA